MSEKQKEWERLQKFLKEQEERQKAEAIGLSVEELRKIITWRFLEFDYVVDGRRKNSREQKLKVISWLKGAWREYPFLVLYGRKGTGKTTLAKKIALILYERGRWVYFIDKKEVDIRLYRFEELDGFIEFLCDVDVLIVDDVGTGYQTDYRSAYFFQVMNYRYAHRKRTVLTTNMDLLAINGDERKLSGAEKDMVLFADRLREVGWFVEFDYPSLRDARVKEKVLRGELLVEKSEIRASEVRDL